MLPKIFNRKKFPVPGIIRSNMESLHDSPASHHITHIQRLTHPKTPLYISANPRPWCRTQWPVTGKIPGLVDGVAFRVRKSHGPGKELQRASELSSFSRSHSPTEHTLHPMSKGDDFPDLVAKNGEFRYMVVRIRYYCCPFARFRLKMTSEMFANGRFWAGDSRQGHTGIPENEKNLCFDRWIEVFTDGHRRGFTINNGGAAALV